MSLIIKMGVFFVFLALGCCWGAVPEVGAAVDPEGNKNPSSAHDEISVSYSIVRNWKVLLCIHTS